MRVTVLAGGPSNERTVSLEGGRAVADACRRLGHEVTLADAMPGNLAALDEPCDVVFPVMHGPFGEDGTLQALLEARGLRYVGSDSAASRVCMDKHEAKRRWREAGLATAEWACVDHESEPLRADRIRPPVVVKPVREGSSVGVVFCETAEQVAAAVDDGLRRFGRVLVERRLSGRELTVGILGDEVLPIVEVRPAAGFYDYEAKYLRDDTQYIVEPDLEPTTYHAVRELAHAAYRLLGCRHYGRVDLILDEQAGPQLLEINTIPGFTEHSLLPKAAAHVGIGFDRLVERLIELATRATMYSSRSA
ncbi:MAG TPA: D-alanine--D-alanine ligase [Thermoguttaceae bacterium]|nr:D-alanine--D-alanine ligase [Thermoguttaceae bacterium]